MTHSQEIKGIKVPYIEEKKFQLWKVSYPDGNEGEQKGLEIYFTTKQEANKLNDTKHLRHYWPGSVSDEVCSFNEDELKYLEIYEYADVFAKNNLTYTDYQKFISKN